MCSLAAYINLINFNYIKIYLHFFAYFKLFRNSLPPQPVYIQQLHKITAPHSPVYYLYCYPNNVVCKKSYKLKNAYRN